MRKLVLALGIALLAFILGSPAFCKAKIEFEKEQIDLGQVSAGKTLTIDFKFTNTGDTDLEINNVHAGCGCTKAQALEKTVAPGKSSTIEAVFNTKGYSGTVSKSIRIQTNDPGKQTVSLRFTGEIVTVAKILPTRINFGTIKPNSTCTKTLEVIPVDPKTFTITTTTSQGNKVSISKYRKIEDKDGVRWILDVVIKAGPDTGRIFENLTILAKSGGNVMLNALVYGNVADN
jgi:hypothetical protein